MDTTPKAFEAHLDFLRRFRYRVIPAPQLVQVKNALPKRSIVLTFDDGYENFYTEAFPRLARYGFTATVFVVTDRIGQKGYLSWEQLYHLHQSGMTIGSHTCTHPHLPDIERSQLEREIRQSRQILEKELKAPVTLFSYPFGGFTREAVALVRQSGYQAAFTTNRGFVADNQDIFTLRRIRMSPRTHPLHLWAKCSGYYNLFRKPRPPH